MNKVLVMTGFLSFLSGMFGSSASAQDYKVAEVYAGLRKMIFETKPANIGVKEPVWGVLMETGYPQAVATLVALADGTVSLYFSNGGGIIGLGRHAGPKRVSKELLVLAPRYLKHCQATKVFPLPNRAHTRFYFLTNDGIVTTEAKEEDLGYQRHALSPLFHKAHELITEVRLVDQKLHAEQGASPDAGTTCLYNPSGESSRALTLSRR